MEAIDELRQIADGQVTYRDAREVMLQAADTIWELRCKLAGVVDQRDEIERLKAENAKLWEILKSLMMGTNAELCAGRGESDCKGCSMYHGEDGCTVVNAMELLGIDMYGEPLGIEVDE